ncbi:MAG: hypothetical protein AAF937_11450 [Planctomycetota bacterium]
MKTQISSIAACVLAAGAGAQFSDPIVTINVSNALGTGTFTADLAQAFPLPNGGLTYSSAAFGPLFPQDITDGGGNVIATINAVNVVAVDDDTSTSNGDGLAVVNFVMSAGDLDTTVEVLSTFVTLPSAFGPTPTVLANAAYTASDDNGDGVTVSGGPTLTDFFVNGDASTGTLFDSLATGFTGGSFASPSTSESSGAVILGQAVDSFQFTSNFSISATDEVSGNFSISVNSIPAPASAVVLAFGGFAAAGRRR